MNAAARRQIKTSPALRLVGRRIQPTDPAAARAFTAALTSTATRDDATPTPGSLVVALPDRVGAGVVATLVPVKPDGDFASASAANAAIFLHDPAAIGPFPGEAFAKLYGLTASELRVVLALTSGLRPQEIAARLGVTLHTVRTHLKHIFQKTGTARQADLLWVIARVRPISV